MQAAHDAGCNFFDNAEAYAGGKSEEIMGRVLEELGWPRHSYVLTTKVFWGIHGNVPNMRNTLNRKYLMQAIDGSLDRLQQDFVDVLYCHRHDPDTTVEETVWAMHDIITSGKALYWGTERVAGRRHPRRDRARRAPPPAQAGHRAVSVQPAGTHQGRRRVRADHRRLRLRQHDLEPAGVRAADRQVPRWDSRRFRGALPGYEWLAQSLVDPDTVGRVERLRPIAERLGCSMAQLALAWCASNPHVSSVITGASRVSQVHDNFAALEVIPLITADVKAEIEEAVSPD